MERGELTARVRSDEGPNLAWAALGVYLIWVLATYLLEGRVSLLQRVDPVGRSVYTIVANMLIGIGLSGWVLRRAVMEGVVTTKHLGFQPIARSLVAIVIAASVAIALFVLQKPPSLKPTVVLNVFAQVFPTSVAEVLVCWAVVGAILEGLVRGRGTPSTSAAILGILAANVLFGTYHFAHSAPFNQLRMVLFLMIPGLVTSLVYFLGRDIYATLIFHNFLGVTGVMRSINLDAFARPLIPLFIFALISIFAVLWTHSFLAQPPKDRR